MGVDYTASYGIGYKVNVTITEKVKESEFWCKDYEELDVWSFLDNILENTEYSYFQTGSECYSGDPNEHFICIDNPFNNGLDLTNKAKELTGFLKKHEIETLTPFDIIGGLEIH